MSDPNLIHYLSTRRTVPSISLGEPGPDNDTLSKMLEIAARVPDHGKLAPWRFIIYDTTKGAEIGERLSAIWLSKEQDATDDRVEAERNRFQRAPLVVGVVSSARPHKIPEWEQILSAGAVCLNLIHAAQAYGFKAQWLTEWYTYDDEAARFLGAEDGERFAGFVHIGTPTIDPVERARPDLATKTTYWNV
ncbi:MAG: nitroreductase [Pseudomonadota bacterium]